MVLVFWIANSEQILVISTLMHFLSYSQNSRYWLVQSSNINTRTVCEICSNLTIKTPGRRHWRRSNEYINFEQISAVPIFDFEQVNDTKYSRTDQVKFVEDSL